MDQNEDLGALERELERAKRLAASTTDRTTFQRLKDFADELMQGLQRHRAARRLREQIRIRAQELWEQNGRPAGRDLEFWVQAEHELNENGR